MTDPGGGDGGSKRGQPAWQLPVGHGLIRPSWASSTHIFPPLGSHPTEVRWQDHRQLPVQANVVLGNRNPIVLDSPIGMGRGSSSVVPPVSGARKHGRGMRPAGDRRSPQKVKDGHTDVRENIIVVSDGLVVKRILEWYLFRLRGFLSGLYRIFGSPLERDRTVVGTVCLSGDAWRGSRTE